jgi:hypothetical protein
MTTHARAAVGFLLSKKTMMIARMTLMNRMKYRKYVNTEAGISPS